MNCLQILTDTEIALLSTLCIRLRFISRFIDFRKYRLWERGRSQHLDMTPVT